jgi:hypothetical protein
VVVVAVALEVVIQVQAVQVPQDKDRTAVQALHLVVILKELAAVAVEQAP